MDTSSKSFQMLKEGYKEKFREMAMREAMLELEMDLGTSPVQPKETDLTTQEKVSLQRIAPYNETRSLRLKRPPKHKRFGVDFAGKEGSQINEALKHLVAKINASDIGATFDQRELAAELVAAVGAKDTASFPYRLFWYLYQRKVITRYRANGRNVIQVASHVDGF